MVNEFDKHLVRKNNDVDIVATGASPLAIAGIIANDIAAKYVFQRYKQEKSANTLKRQARDLELFAEYLIDAGIPLQCANFQEDPICWQGITWGIVEGFVQWLLREGYAITTVNSYLSTVRTYAKLAVKAGAIERTEGMLIEAVKGYSRKGATNINQQREQTRVESVTYAYKPKSAKKHVIVTRRNTKKQKATQLTAEQAEALQTPRNNSPQAYRDALLMSLLLAHGLRASEIALLTTENIHLERGEIRFFRPKVQGTEHEWTTHRLLADTQTLSAHYLEVFYPPTLLPNGKLILATTRLLKDGTGGELIERGLNRVRVSERVSWLGKQLGIVGLSAHDCRHFCATQMASLDYSVHELMAWFGWNNAQTAMRYIANVDVKERYKG
jgi:integrase